jgi:hypothetical protein
MSDPQKPITLEDLKLTPEEAEKFAEGSRFLFPAPDETDAPAESSKNVEDK